MGYEDDKILIVDYPKDVRNHVIEISSKYTRRKKNLGISTNIEIIIINWNHKRYHIST